MKHIFLTLAALAVFFVSEAKAGLYVAPSSLEQLADGTPCTGCQLFFYEPGTTTEKTVYQDKALTTPHANPVVADSAGRFDPIYMDGTYKVVLKDADDVTIDTTDNFSTGSSADFFGETEIITTTTAIDSGYEKKHLRIECTTACNLNLLDISTAGEGFEFSFRNHGTATATIDPNASEQVNDVSTWSVPPAAGGIIVASSAEWSLVEGAGFPQTKTTGDIYYYSEGSSEAVTALAIGNEGELLTVGSSGLPEWGGVSVPTGSVIFFASSTAPTGYLLAYGQAVSRTTYSDLFNTIGTTFGVGDGSTTFNLPDCRGRVIAGEDDMGGASANRLTDQSGGLNGDTLGDTGGSETHTLTSGEMPSHTHSISGANSGTSGTARVRTTNAAEDNTITTASTGSGGAHNNVQPTIIMGCIIKT